MPAKPSAAAARSAATGNSSRASQPGACGSHSVRAKSRAVSWNASCSSDSEKSIASDLHRLQRAVDRRDQVGALLRIGDAEAPPFRTGAEIGEEPGFVLVEMQPGFATAIK